MLKYYNSMITFSEVPDEISLCINISNCPIKCPDCHSNFLWEKIGKEITDECLDCGHIEKIPVEKCPKCESYHLTHWTRIIGYLRPIKCFDKYRQIEASTRVYSNGKEEIK